MKGNSKLASYRLDQSFPPVHIPNPPALGEVEDLLGALVVAPRPAETWQQSGNPLLLEGLIGDIECLAADPESFGHVADRAALDPMAAQHLVFDLHDVAGVEELAVVEFRIVDLVGCRVQRTLFEEGPDLRMLAVALCGHRDLRGSVYRS